MMVKDGESRLAPISIHTAHLYLIAFSVVGLMTLVQVTVRLIDATFSELLNAARPSQSGLVARDSIYRLSAVALSSVVQVMIGLLLLLGARGIAKKHLPSHDAVLNRPEGPPPTVPDEV